MTLFHQPEAFALLVPALYRRAHLVAQATAREFAQPKTTRITHYRRPGVLRETLRMAGNLLLALWGMSVLAFWLVVIGVGFLR